MLLSLKITKRKRYDSLKSEIRGSGNSELSFDLQPVSSVWNHIIKLGRSSFLYINGSIWLCFECFTYLLIYLYFQNVISQNLSKRFPFSVIMLSVLLKLMRYLLKRKQNWLFLQPLLNATGVSVTGPRRWPLLTYNV